MKVYAESSAVLSWLLGEGLGQSVRSVLTSAEIVVASDLTLIECHRALMRTATQGAFTEAQAADWRAHLAQAATGWHLLRINPEIAERAKQPFPFEPLRTLDALHLSSALLARAKVPGLALLSLDQRVRKNARELGFSVLPKE